MNFENIWAEYELEEEFEIEEHLPFNLLPYNTLNIDMENINGLSKNIRRD
jgi:hypothetical protein